jgi:hypothetical protein
MATITKVIRKSRGKKYEYHAVRSPIPAPARKSCATFAATRTRPRLAPK